MLLTALKANLRHLLLLRATLVSIHYGNIIQLIGLVGFPELLLLVFLLSYTTTNKLILILVIFSFVLFLSSQSSLCGKTDGKNGSLLQTESLL